MIAESINLWVPDLTFFAYAALISFGLWIVFVFRSASKEHRTGIKTQDSTPMIFMLLFNLMALILCIGYVV